MELKVDRGFCSGTGQCVMALPGIFDQDDSGHVVVLVAEPTPDLWPDVREAAAWCPVGAIDVVEHGHAQRRS